MVHAVAIKSEDDSVKVRLVYNKWTPTYYLSVNHDKVFIHLDGEYPVDIHKTETEESSKYTISVHDFIGATNDLNGTRGTVPAPSAGDQHRYLSANGTWSTVASKTDTGFIINASDNAQIDVEPIPMASIDALFSN